MNSHAILTCLPLLAGVLGRAYGVTVEIGGNDAFTNGKTIRLPSLPTTGDPTFIGLVRGYIDHESAHIRHTDFRAMNREALTALEQHIWNIFEDWRVEQRLGAQFPGCHQNFRWLIRHVFLKSPRPQRLSVFAILDWLLLTVRSWEVAELTPLCLIEQGQIDHVWPGLLSRLKAILITMRGYCPDSLACLEFARQVVRCLSDTALKTGSSSFGMDLQTLIRARTDELPDDLGEILRRSMGKGAAPSSHSAVATVGVKHIEPLSAGELEEIHKITAGLRAKFHGLFQATHLVQQKPSRQGKINPRRLHGISIGQPRVFLAHERKQAISTAVHILLDSSMSMDRRITLASQSCAALAQALRQVGISVGITAFPGTQAATVVPVLRHGDQVHGNLRVEARGQTPLAEALWWVLQRLLSEPEDRKIVVIVTDGAPDNRATAKEAVQAGHKAGVEIYGLGILAPSINQLLPRHSADVSTLQELPPVLFKLLEQALLHQGNQ
jgi:hypothetical protein